MIIKSSHGKHELHDLSLADRCAMRRQYRTLRIVIYAPSSSGYPLYNGEYGMSRSSAKRALLDFYRNLSWYSYLGSK